MPYKKGKGLVAAALVASLCLLPGLVPAPVQAAGEALRADTRRHHRIDKNQILFRFKLIKKIRNQLDLTLRSQIACINRRKIQLFLLPMLSNRLNFIR
mgnify:CR=1 FL=1